MNMYCDYITSYIFLTIDIFFSSLSLGDIIIRRELSCYYYFNAKGASCLRFKAIIKNPKPYH